MSVNNLVENFSGVGIYYNFKDEIVDFEYNGSFLNGKYNGKGELKFKNWDNYIVEFEEGKICGHGVFDYKNGSRYEGNFKNGLRNGFGKFSFKNGNIYEGFFEDGQFNGFGIYYYRTSDQDSININRYEGYFKNDRCNGKGTFYYNDGSKYESIWINGNRISNLKYFLSKRRYLFMMVSY